MSRADNGYLPLPLYGRSLAENEAKLGKKKKKTRERESSRD